MKTTEVIFIANQFTGVERKDFIIFTAYQERLYRRLRKKYFEQLISNGDFLTEFKFKLLSKYDQLVFLQCLGRIDIFPPAYIIQIDRKRYFYNSWYKSKNKMRLKKWRQEYISNFTTEQKELDLKRRCSASAKSNKTDKGKKRVAEYARNYRRRKESKLKEELK